MSETERLSCAEVCRRLDDFLDRELTPDEAVAVESHLEACLVCAREHTFERTVIDSIRTKLKRIQVPSTLADRISRCIAEEGRSQA